MSAPDPGLQAQRTSLSWTRTSLAVLANGVLFMFRDLQLARPGFGLLAGGVAIVVAVSIYLVGARRQAVLAHHPLPRQITPRIQVHLVTAAVLVLVAFSVLPLLLQGAAQP